MKALYHSQGHTFFLSHIVFYLHLVSLPWSGPSYFVLLNSALGTVGSLFLKAGLPHQPPSTHVLSPKWFVDTTWPGLVLRGTGILLDCVDLQPRLWRPDFPSHKVTASALNSSH